MNWTHQKRAYKARLLQWDGTNLSAVSVDLRKLGYESFELERGTIMARGKGMSLLCVHQGNWLRFGQNGSFKVMRPDEQATYVLRQTDNELRDENDRLRAANKDLQEWFDITKAKLDALELLGNEEAYMNGIEAGKHEFRQKLIAAEDELDMLKSQKPCSYEVYSNDTVEFSANYEQACHEHISCAITDYDIEGAEHWKVRPVYASPVPAIPKGMALVPTELTAENGAKSALIGEKFAGENISWSAIKEIHKAVVSFFDIQKRGV